jgi:hypothetical protein
MIRKSQIIKLLSCSQLNGWELNFLSTLDEREVVRGFIKTSGNEDVRLDQIKRKWAKFS